MMEIAFVILSATVLFTYLNLRKQIKDINTRWILGMDEATDSRAAIKQKLFLIAKHFAFVFKPCCNSPECKDMRLSVEIPYDKIGAKKS